MYQSEQELSMDHQLTGHRRLDKENQQSNKNVDQKKINRLGLGDLRIIQRPGLFKFTIDPILLAAFCHIYPQEQVIDLGTGGGVIPLWLSGYRGVQKVTGLELQPEVAEVAKENVTLNGLQERITIIQGDLRAAASVLKGELFDWVVSNPPYIKATAGSVMDNQVLAKAKFELACTLEDVVRSASQLTPNNGRFAVVHLPQRLPEIMVLMKGYGFEPKRLALIHPKLGAPPHRVLVEGRKSARPGLFILKPFIIHRDDGEFTEEMNQVYQGGTLREK